MHAGKKFLDSCFQLLVVETGCCQKLGVQNAHKGTAVTLTLSAREAFANAGEGAAVETEFLLKARIGIDTNVIRCFEFVGKEVQSHLQWTEGVEVGSVCHRGGCVRALPSVPFSFQRSHYASISLLS